MEVLSRFLDFLGIFNTRTIKIKDGSDKIDTANHRNKYTLLGGVRLDRFMRHRYSQFDELLKPFLRYTWEM